MCKYSSPRPRVTFRCDSQFLRALSAARLPAPLGIASLMNANGKGLIQLKRMNNGGAWWCSAPGGGNHGLGGGFTKREKVRHGLEIPTFTWILIGRGIPSFSSLVFSLKSLQNCPMGIPLWMGNKHGIKPRVALLKCMRSLSWKTFRCHTVSHGAGRMQMPPRLSLNHSQTPRRDGIHSHNRHIYDKRANVFHPGVFMCNRVSMSFY